MGRNILINRKKKMLSQLELGRKIGVTKQMIGQYESGEATPGKEKLYLIAEALGVTVAELYSDKEKENITSVEEPDYRTELIESLKRENALLREQLHAKKNSPASPDVPELRK